MFTVGDVFVPSPPKRWKKSSILSYSLNDSLVLILENYPLAYFVHTSIHSFGGKSIRQ